MLSIDGRKSKTGIAIIFFSICFSAVSAGAEDNAIEISDSLTLHSGDIITLQADDNTYITVADLVSCLSQTPLNSKQRRPCLQRTKTAHPDKKSDFIVEVAENDQIRLRTSDNDLYLRYFKETRRSGYDCVGFPIILVEDTAPVDPNSMFTVIKTEDENKIALRAFDGKYLNRVNKDVWAEGIKSTRNLFGKTRYRLISVESNSSEGSSVFTVDRTGIDPDYVQSVSDIEFDLTKFRVSTTPTVVAQTDQNNNGSGEMIWTLDVEEVITTMNKWTWEKGTEFAVGTTLTGKLGWAPSITVAGVSAEGISAGMETEVSTEIRNYTKDTNEYTEEVEKSISFTETIPIPAHTRVTGKVIADIAKVDVPYTALVTVKSKDGKETYTDPINGTYSGTSIVNVHVEVNQESLIQTPEMNESQTVPVAPTAET